MSYLFFDFLEPITNAWFGNDVAWLDWIALDLPSQIADVDAQKMGIHLIISAPNFLDQLLVSEHFAGMIHKCAQNAVFRGCKRYGKVP